MSGFKKKGTFGRSNVRKRAASSDEDADDGVEPSVSTAPEPAERKKKTLALGGSTKDDRGKIQVFAFEGDRTLQTRGDGGATAGREIDTDKETDGRAMREKALATASARVDGFEDDKIYKGSANYVDYRAGFRKELTISSDQSHGPMRASANVRSTFIMDYKPDICKDYKETGFCGYGDSCKFLHDRGDYKHGWQLDKEWEAKEKAKKEAAAKLEKMERELGADGEALHAESDDDGEDELPAACAICGSVWSEAKDPIVTKCKHYFCEHCALKHNAKEKNCFACQKSTGGTFNTAKEIVKRVKEMKATGATWAKTRAKPSGAGAAANPEFNNASAQGWLLG
jgi:RING finger protein 113A